MTIPCKVDCLFNEDCPEPCGDYSPQQETEDYTQGQLLDQLRRWDSPILN